MEKACCYCGHDCSRCLTYLATKYNDDGLRKQSQRFYLREFGLRIPLSDIHCSGGRAEDVFRLCRECPWAKCCRERGIGACAECDEYPCEPLRGYIEKYVNRCHQLPRPSATAQEAAER